MQPWMLSAPVPFPAAGVGAPLTVTPPVQTAARRLVELAEANGLVVVPQWYAPRLEARMGGGTATGKWQVNADAAEGPYFITDLRLVGAADRTEIDATMAVMAIQTGARQLVDGWGASYDDVLGLPHARGQQALPAPIIAMRSDTVTVTLALTSGVWTTGTVLAFCGWVLRNRDGSRVGALADEIARTLLAEGELYVCGVAPDVSGVDAGIPYAAQQNLNAHAIVQRLSYVAPTSVVEGSVGASAAELTIGNYKISPLPLMGVVSAVALNADQVWWVDDVRMPIPLGQQLRLSVTYPVGTPVRARAVLVGRRVIRP